VLSICGCSIIEKDGFFEAREHAAGRLSRYIYIFFLSLFSFSLLLHVHLREGTIMETVVPAIRQSGVDMVYVRDGT